MGLRPNHDLISCALAEAGRIRGCIAAIYHIAQQVGRPAVVSYAHVLGVNRRTQIAAYSIQQLTVAIQLQITALLGVVLGAVDDGGPEVAAIIPILGNFDGFII